MGGGDGGLAAGHLPQGHHVIRGQTLVARADAVHGGHLHNVLSVKILRICSSVEAHLEWVDGEGRQAGHIVAGLGRLGGDHLVLAPVRLLTLPDVDDVVTDLREVDMQRRRPGELNTPGVELHDERLAGGARDIWKCTVLEVKPWRSESCKLESFRIKLNASQTFPRTYELNHFMLTENLKRISLETKLKRVMLGKIR